MIGAGAKRVKPLPTMGIAPPARNNAADRAAARIIPIMAFRFIVVASPKRGIGQEGQCPRALDCDGQCALMPGAVAGDAARDDLSSLGNETLQGPDVLVVSLEGFVSAESAN